MDELISVFIPVYRESEPLGSLLEDLMKDPCEKKEIFVIVDEPTKQCLENVSKYKDKVEFILNGQRKGKVNVLNEAGEADLVDIKKKIIEVSIRNITVRELKIKKHPLDDLLKRLGYSRKARPAILAWYPVSTKPGEARSGVVPDQEQVLSVRRDRRSAVTHFATPGARTKPCLIGV